MLRLWICLYLPNLSIEVFRPNWSTELAVAVLDNDRVHLASRLALAAGVRPAMRRGGVQTMASQLLGFPRHLSQHSGGFVLARGKLSRLAAAL